MLDSPKSEALRDASLPAPTLDDQQRLVRQIHSEPRAGWDIVLNAEAKACALFVMARTSRTITR